MKPYYEHAGITIFNADSREIMEEITADVLVTDPPYGINYSSQKTGQDGGTALPGIIGDEDTAARDSILKMWGDRPAIVFGSRKTGAPPNCRAILIWEKGPHVGMGDLSLPWKPNYEEIYILGAGFHGARTSSVLRYLAPLPQNSFVAGRRHAHQKPLRLLVDLIAKCPPGSIFDPFLGSGTTLVAAKFLGRRAIGVEIEERYCAVAAKRLTQDVLPLNIDGQIGEGAS